MNTTYAGFGSRLLAAIVDSLILGVVNFGAGLVIGMAMGNDTSVQYVAQGIGLVLAILYYVVYQNKTGQTFGKKALGLKVVNANGETPGMGTLALREIVGKWVSAIILGIGYLWMLWDPRKQCLHDKIASTFVVKV
jgi:uncharacterized RDD family membrane protein YckC